MKDTTKTKSNETKVQAGEPLKPSIFALPHSATGIIAARRGIGIWLIIIIVLLVVLGAFVFLLTDINKTNNNNDQASVPVTANETESFVPVVTDPEQEQKVENEQFNNYVAQFNDPNIDDTTKVLIAVEAALTGAQTYTPESVFYAQYVLDNFELIENISIEANQDIPIDDDHSDGETTELDPLTPEEIKSLNEETKRKMLLIVDHRYDDATGVKINAE